MITRIIKYVSLPVLLITAFFSCLAASHEFVLDITVCAGAVIAAQHAAWVREYFWSAAFVAIALIFSPLVLVVKIFLLMGTACVAAFATLLAAWKTQPMRVA